MRWLPKRPARGWGREIQRSAPGGSGMASSRYRVLYRTVNAVGQPVRASGLVAFPSGGPRRLPLVSYDHGTASTKRDAPSSFGLDKAGDGIEGRWSAELFAWGPKESQPMIAPAT